VDQPQRLLHVGAAGLRRDDDQVRQAEGEDLDHAPHAGQIDDDEVGAAVLEPRDLVANVLLGDVAADRNARHLRDRVPVAYRVVRVGVEQPDAVPHLRQPARQDIGRRALAHASLRARHRNHPRHAYTPMFRATVEE
jgi:hypothetical protein